MDSKIVKMHTSDAVSQGSLLKYTSLFLLLTQNVVFFLSMRYVRTREEKMFLATTAVVLQESIKCLISLLVILYQEGGPMQWLRHLRDNIIKQPVDCLKMAVPSAIYTLQNNLIYVGVSNLDACTVQVTYQLKILATGVLSYIILKKQLTKLQWLALITLVVGVCFVQVEHVDNDNVTTVQKPFIGLCAILTASIMSGFVGVYFEKILKDTPQSVWLRNVQLGGIGAVVGYITMEISDGHTVRENGFFFGYDKWVWFVIVVQSCGGLIVALVMKHADNILKCFATSLAIVVSCIGSMFFFDLSLSIQFCIGASLVIIAIYLYTIFSHSKPVQIMIAPKEQILLV